ncbi:MAG: matrixin family metalloprotease [Candidatus Melainabacteria bacterium]|nr:MAG: matrixin family metalloprotease [Candidatus Melainabacteria bacterium]
MSAETFSGWAGLRRAVTLVVSACVVFAFDAASDHGLALAADSSDELSTADKDDRVYNIVKQAQPLISEKKFVEARKLLKEGALLDPTTNSGNLHASLAFVAHQLGDPAGAIAESQLAMKFDPRFVDELTWNVAMAYKDLGEYGMAREWLQKYLDTNPADPKRKRDAEEFSRKLGEQENSNSSQSIHGPDYLDALVRQHGVGRWARSSFPLKIFVEKAEKIPGVPADDVQMLMDCFDAWNKASGGLLPVQQVPKAKQADITIQWTDVPSKVSAHDGVHLEQGITRVMAYQSPGSAINTIRSATIVLLTVNRDTGKPLAEDEMKAVCLHEIGHAFGLGGHSANSSDTMYFSSSARQLPALSHRDKTTISRLYSVGSTSPVSQNSFGASNTSAPLPPFSIPQNQSGPGSQIGFPQRNPYQQRNMQGTGIYQQGTIPQGSYPQGSYPQGSYPQGSYPQGAYPQGSYPQGSYPSGSYPPGSYPPASYPQGSYPPASYPQGAYPQGSYPPASYPQGAYPQGSYPPGSYPQGAYPQGSYPQGSYPQGAYPPGSYAPGSYPQGPYPQSSYPQGPQPQQGQQSNKQSVPFPQASN